MSDEKIELSLEQMLGLANKIQDWKEETYYSYIYYGSIKDINFKVYKTFKEGIFRDKLNGYSLFAEYNGITLGNYCFSLDDPKKNELLKNIKKNIEQQKRNEIKDAVHYAIDVLDKD